MRSASNRSDHCEWPCATRRAPNSPAHIVGTPTLPTAECCLHALLDETLLDPIHLARTDAQDLGNGLPARPVLVELALVRVEQNQRVDHLLRLMRPLARDPREFVTLVLLQSHHVTLHATLDMTPINFVLEA